MSPEWTGPGAMSGGCAPGQQHLWWGGSGSQNKAAFNWPGREWQEGRSGECSQLDRKNWFRVASPTKEKRLAAQPGLPCLNLWHLAGVWGAPPKGRVGLWLKLQ